MNALLKQFKMVQQMMKQMTKAGKGKRGRMRDARPDSSLGPGIGLAGAGRRPLRLSRSDRERPGWLDLTFDPSSSTAAIRPSPRGASIVAVKIRLMRVGKKKQPTYRVVVADARSPRDGRIIETIGHYGPRQEPSHVRDRRRPRARLAAPGCPADRAGPEAAHGHRCVVDVRGRAQGQGRDQAVAPRLRDRQGSRRPPKAVKPEPAAPAAAPAAAAPAAARAGGGSAAEAGGSAGRGSPGRGGCRTPRRRHAETADAADAATEESSE